MTMKISEIHEPKSKDGTGVNDVLRKLEVGQAVTFTNDDGIKWAIFRSKISSRTNTVGLKSEPQKRFKSIALNDTQVQVTRVQ